MLFCTLGANSSYRKIARRKEHDRELA